MEKHVTIFSVIIVIICVSIFCAGCTKTADSANTNTPLTTQPTTIDTGALYTAGDIVKSPSGSAGSGWLILGYDPATDMYSRAFIYQNSDGSWGYRVNTNTENSARKTMEKVYTDKVTHVTVSSVPVKGAAASPTSVTSSATGSSTTTTVTTTAGKPQFKSMTPDEGNAGTTVSVTDLVGSNFQSTPTVALAHTGSPNIAATNVQWLSSSHLTCMFTIPSNTTAGVWDVIITNPDGQSVTYGSYFTIHPSTSVTATATTTSTSSLNTISISDVSPSSIATGDLQTSGQRLRIMATNLQPLATVVLQRSGYTNITSTETYPESASTLLATFTIPAASHGSWNVIVTNPDGTYGIWSHTLTVT
jgi:hypothetical protein